METPTPEKHEFQAEVKQVLDIVVHSLYTDREIFLRELVSNASDASEKLRHLQLTETAIFDEHLPLEINLTGDDQAGLITLQDFGLGMTREELIENLGTIAHSGSKAFLQALKAAGQSNDNLIGQFGVGFYSSFMVADRVEVFSRSWRPEATGWKWTSDGSGSYEIEPAEGLRRGTKIVLHLKPEFKEFARQTRLQDILHRYSRFVPFPIQVAGEKINTVQAIWLKNKAEVKDEEYPEFYKFHAGTADAPRHWLHFNADAPLAIHALLFCPEENPERFGFGRVDSGVSLYCRKILITGQPKGLLPDWLRFLHGVVDSSDLPLNISRETMQDSALIKKLNGVLTKRYLKHLETLSKKDPDAYDAFWSRFQHFLKEGVSSDYEHREALGKLLRFESSLTEPGKRTSLEDYLTRAREGQKEIYYLYGPNRAHLEAGPFLEAFKARSLEVLYLFEPVDEFVMNHLARFQEKRLVSADSQDIELPDLPDPSGRETLPADRLDPLLHWIKSVLGDRVGRVDAGSRLIGSPALVLNTNRWVTHQMRRIMENLGQDSGASASDLAFQVNPRHPLIHNLAALHSTHPERAAFLLETLFDNCRLAAGILEDPKDLIQRISQLLDQSSGPGKGSNQ